VVLQVYRGVLNGSQLVAVKTFELETDADIVRFQAVSHDIYMPSTLFLTLQLNGFTLIIASSIVLYLLCISMAFSLLCSFDVVVVQEVKVMHDLYNLRHIVKCIPYYPKPNSKSTPRKGGMPVKRLLLMELMEVIRVEETTT